MSKALAEADAAKINSHGSLDFVLRIESTSQGGGRKVVQPRYVVPSVSPLVSDVGSMMAWSSVVVFAAMMMSASGEINVQSAVAVFVATMMAIPTWPEPKSIEQK